MVPVTSIIIPTYNASAYIRDQLKSLTFQTIQNADILLIDFRCIAISPLVEKILIENNIKHKTKPLEVKDGNDIEYKLVSFPEMLESRINI